MHGHIQKKDLVAFLMADNLGGGRCLAGLLWQLDIMLMFFCSIIIVCIEDRPESQSPNLDISSPTCMRAACCSQSDVRQPTQIRCCSALFGLLQRMPRRVSSCCFRHISRSRGFEGGLRFWREVRWSFQAQLGYMSSSEYEFVDNDQRVDDDERYCESLC